MSNFEDHFSRQARTYASFRPQYPTALFDYLASIAPARDLAWDCGTGNGQAARALAERFASVVATDASAEQIAQALPHERVEYRVERSEDVVLEAGSVDLITSAQAAHWFDLDTFYAAARRAACPSGVIALWGYHFPVIDPAVDALLRHFYFDVVGSYWPERIRYLEEQYRTLPFPFAEVEAPGFVMQIEWDVDQMIGFLDSWSSVQRYIADRGRHPVKLIWDEMQAAWGEGKRLIDWPVFMRVGRVG